ncbi:MAG TPA: carbohydrate ABC transporter permease [Geminicoccus sp.]|jgi:sorbitol/mannitol transport system permease protein|uniref:carbohydrate ABC transporter permease n=1 Tax=Geminicoccus sp. TaxID=2024832 RepID=UPI002E379048|nr:carbohydrate ABC transporter permease [Geminicoccus sp.]HEX2527960.1 carbohydrate ABC transporter permease [Geminicoccus sp.]
MRRSGLGIAILGHGLALLMFFPILWMGLTAFKTEIDAFSMPPVFIFEPTLSSLNDVFSRGSYSKFVTNSIIASLGSTALCLLFAIPAAYQMSFYPSKRTNGTLLWMISTKMMPAVGVIMPIYLIFQWLGLLDRILGLILIFFLMNLPLAVWMLYTYFKEIPHEMLEAARVDGAGILEELRFILLPASIPGIASTALLMIILCWNESFWSLQLTASDAAPLTVFIASFKAAEGMFWAKMSGASILAIGPIVVLGWLMQRHLVRGLTFGAVK